MITIQEFFLLSEEEKLKSIKMGNYLAQREEKYALVKLYCLEAFYVEVFQDFSNQRVFIFHPFSFGAYYLLVPYLQDLKRPFQR
jgi:hypothetical protein